MTFLRPARDFAVEFTMCTEVEFSRFSVQRSVDLAGLGEHAPVISGSLASSEPSGDKQLVEIVGRRDNRELKVDVFFTT